MAMSISYQKLWNLLNERNISKSDFRLAVDISTVTLAKMSKNESISLSIIEKICDTLDCQIEDVLEIVHETRNDRWRKIKDDEYYLVDLFYVVEQNEEEICNVDFLYGYAIAVGKTRDLIRKIEINRKDARGVFSIYEIKHQITGDQLKVYLQCIEDGETIDTFIKKTGYEVKFPKNKAVEWQESFLSFPVYYEERDYRPEFLLIPEEESRNNTKYSQPLHAYGNEPLLCEAYVYRQKQRLYRDADGNLDRCKMKMVYDLFKSEGFFINGYKDIVRIGDFELFSKLVPNASQEEVFAVESIVRENEKRQKILEGFKVKLFPEYLSGEYVLTITTINAGNPTTCRLFEFFVDGEIVERDVFFPESSGTIELKLWKKDKNLKIQLVGYHKSSVVRGLDLEFRIVEQSVTLEDEYTKKSNKTSSHEVNKKVETYTSENIRLRNDENDPWRKMFIDVERDFDELYGSETAESMFFEAGMDKHEAFLQWLKRQINQKNIHSVWIFDPYIDKESLPRLLRLLNNMSVKLHVVTSKHKDSKDETRLQELKMTCEQFGVIFSQNMKIEIISRDDELHDRLLFLCGANYYPQVYNLSNSLDSIGMNKPSVICKLDRHVGGQVAEYYFDLRNKMSEIGKLQTVWESQKTEPNNKIPLEEDEEKFTVQAVAEYFNHRLKACMLDELTIVNERIELPITSSLEEIMEKLCEQLPEDFEMVSALIAYVAYPEHEEIKKYIVNNYNSNWTKSIRDKLDVCLEKATAKESRTDENIAVLRGQNFKVILKSMGHLLEYAPDSLLKYRLRWLGNYAADILMICDFDAYASLMEQIIKIENWASFKKCEILLYKLANRMACSDSVSAMLARKCLQSNVDELIALAMQWFIKKRDIRLVSELVKNDEHLHAFLAEYIIDLQVEDCRNGYRNAIESNKIMDEKWLSSKDSWTVIMQQAKEMWVDTFSDDLTANELCECFAGLAMRNCMDIYDLAMMLYDRGKISGEELGLFCNKQLFAKVYDKKDGYWSLRDFHDGEIYLRLLSYNSLQGGRQNAIDKMAGYEKKVLKELQDVFLPKKDYAKWKWNIDSLIWCYSMRLLCSKEWCDYAILTSKDPNLQSRQKEIIAVVKKYEITLEKYSEAYRVLVNTFNFDEMM